jgi:pimeloyl-ACP methyl ester carboxylesterase
MMPPTEATVMTAFAHAMRFTVLSCMAAGLACMAGPARADWQDIRAELEAEGLPLPEAHPRPPAPEPLNARRRTHEFRRAQPLPDVDGHAAALLPYAALATEVYCSAVVEQKPDPDECRNKHLAEDHHWKLLKRYPTDLAGPHNFHGMIFATYYRERGPAQAPEIAVAFRGTDFKSPADWHANLRWFLPGRDQYDVLAERVTDVIRESKQMADLRLADDLAKEGRSRLNPGWQIVATGHSLGGGLAQMFAYKSSEVNGAVAFDPSPVTAFTSCVADHEVNCNVPVWRVYERGEVLSYVRAVTRLFYVLSENITELEFNLMGGNPILNHSISRFHDSLKSHLVQRPYVARWMQADLFDPRPDCECSRQRRPELFAAVAEECARLQAQRDSTAPLQLSERGPDWPELSHAAARLMPHPRTREELQAQAQPAVALP